MHTRFLMIGMLVCIQPFYTHADSLKEAMDTAAKQHPVLQMAEQNIAAARGNLAEQRAYAYNPELSLEPQRRRLNGGGTANDYYITLSQGIEIGGKRGLREQSAQAALENASLRRESTRQQLMLEAARAYVALYFSNRIVELRQQQSEMIEKVSQAVSRQLELGESSQLDANLAQSAFASALNTTTAAQQQLTQNKRRYALALGNIQQTETPLRLQLPPLDTAWQPPPDAYNVALQSRPDLSALRARVTQFEAQADLASVSRIPDITFSAMSGREAGEKLVKLGITIPFPLLNSHQGAYRAALAEKEHASTGLAWSQERLRYAVQSAMDNHANAMQALSGMLQTNMLQRAKDTIILARRAYDAGELDLEELVVHIQQGIDAQMTALEIIRQGWLSRIRLAEVLGHPEYILKGIQP